MQKYKKNRICKIMNEKNYFFLFKIKKNLLFLQPKNKYNNN